MKTTLMKIIPGKPIRGWRKRVWDSMIQNVNQDNDITTTISGDNNELLIIKIIVLGQSTGSSDYSSGPSLKTNMYLTLLPSLDPNTQTQKGKPSLLTVLNAYWQYCLLVLKQEQMSGYRRSFQDVFDKRTKQASSSWMGYNQHG